MINLVVAMLAVAFLIFWIAEAMIMRPKTTYGVQTSLFRMYPLSTLSIVTMIVVGTVERYQREGGMSVDQWVMVICLSVITGIQWFAKIW